MGLAPLLFYLVCFVLLTWPMIREFSTHFFADEGDGLQNVWNIWWVDHAIRSGRSPWFTRLLHHPHGVTLLGHTLNPFNGLLAVGLLRVLTLVQTHNVVVLLGFVGAGWTTFLLAHHLTGRWAASLLAGYLFTFSSFHFAHATGHLQLVSVEWLPLFLLLWHRFLDAPGTRTAIGAGLVLFLVILCDYYYFLYAVGAGTILVAWHAAARRRPGFLLAPGARTPLAAFLATVLLTSGPLVFSLLRLTRKDPLVGGHPSEVFSTDLLAPFVPGGHWRFNWLTESVWTSWTGHLHESSVSLGLAALALSVLAWRRRRSFLDPSLRAWLWIALVFWVSSLGPVLHLAGRTVMTGLPYAWIEWLVPPLRLSGVPVRMMVMVQLAAALLAAFGWALLARGPRGARVLAGAALLATALELLHTPIPTTAAVVPGYVEVLRHRPEKGGLLDRVYSDTQRLLHQTVHGTPLVFGYVARTPSSVERKNRELNSWIHRPNLKVMCERYRIRFLLVKDPGEILTGLSGVEILYREGEVRLAKLECAGLSDPPAPR